MNRARTVILLAFACLAAAAARGQEWRGPASLAVEVKGKPRGSVEGALVILRYQQVRPAAGPRPVLTDASGRAVVADLAPGVWEVEVSHEDFLSFVAVVVLDGGRKPTVQASFLQASGSSLTPIRVKFTDGRGRTPSASVPLPPEAAARLAARRPPPLPEPRTPQPTGPPRVGTRRPPPPVMPEPELRPLPPSAQPEPAPAPAEPTAPAEPAAPEPAPPSPPAAAEPAVAAAPPEPAAPVPPPAPAPETTSPPAEPAAPEAPAAEPSAPPAEAATPPAPAPVPASPPAEPAAPPPAAAPEPSPPPAEPAAPAAPSPDLPARPEPPAPSEPPAAPEPSAPAKAPAPPEPAPAPALPAPAPAAPKPEPVQPPVPAEPAPQPTEPSPAPSPAAEPPPPMPEAAAAPTPIPPPTRPDAAALPPPGSLGPTLRAYRDQTCIECRPGEWALSGEVVAGPSTGPCDAAALAADGAALAEVLGGSIALELKEIAAPARQALGEMDAGEAATRGGDLLGGRSSSCRIVAVVIPKAGRFRGLRMEAADASGIGDCQADRDCPVGRARWLGQPRVSREPSANVIWGLFVNQAPDRARRARLTVYFAAPNRAWDPPR